MVIGERLREIRESKDLSQVDIEKRSGLLRCYLSRVENGHTVPSVETLERLARAMEVPIYKLFYAGREPAKVPDLPKHARKDANEWGSSGDDAKMLSQFQRILSRTNPKNQRLLLLIAQKMARSNRPKA